MPEYLENLKQLPKPHLHRLLENCPLVGSGAAYTLWGSSHPALSRRKDWPQEQFLPVERRQQAVHLWASPENAQFPLCHQLVCSQIHIPGQKGGK